MSMLPGIICDYESRGLEEAGELAGLSDEGRVKAMHIATQTGTLSRIEDSTGPGSPDGTDICASVAIVRCDWRRKNDLETEQILTNILSGSGGAEHF